MRCWSALAASILSLGVPVTQALAADAAQAAPQEIAWPLLLGAAVLLLGVAVYVGVVNRREHRSKTALAHRSRELVLHNQILQLITSGAPLPVVLDELARRVEELHPGALCSILLLDESGQRVRHGAAPSLPEFYCQAIDGVQIGDGIGSCGTAAYRGERVVVENIQEHPYWVNFRDLAKEADLASCWSQPFKGGDGRVLGTFAIYHHEPTAPSGAEVGLIEDYASLARLAVERSRTEAALSRTEAQYRLIADNSSDVIWLMSLPDLKFTYVSPSAERLRGWTPEEIMAQPVEAALTPASAALMRDLLARSMERLASGDRTARVSIAEVDQIHKDGHVIHTEVVTTLLLDDTGEPTQILGMTRDITRRKQVEAELDQYRHHLEKMVAERTVALSVAKDSAEAANRAKSTFLANMSHELRTPMNAIMGMTELALRRTVDSKQQQQLEKVVQASHHLLAIINDILDLSRIDAGRIPIDDTPLEIGPLFDELMPLVSEKASEKGLQLTLDLPAALAGLRVAGDPLRLQQVLINLIGNAIKFTPSGSVSVRVASQAIEPDKVRLSFSVADTGIGIAQADQARLFNAFEQADGSLTRRYGGTGLGLAICKRLVKLMGGEIGLDSQPGKGSTFWFSVTLKRLPPAAELPLLPCGAPAEEEIRRRHGGKRILLVEDEPMNREVAGELLHEAGLLVDQAGDGQEAVDKFRQQAYAAILMDIQMPRLNGIEATLVIRTLDHGRDVPILAMTANAFSEDRQRCLSAGMNDHIGKPVEPELLFKRLLLWLDGGPATKG